jgi:hypothetical protein
MLVFQPALPPYKLLILSIINVSLHAQAICLQHLQLVCTAQTALIFSLELVKVVVFLQAIITIILMIIITLVWHAVQAVIPVMVLIHKTVLLVLVLLVAHIY